MLPVGIYVLISQVASAIAAAIALFCLVMGLKFTFYIFQCRPYFWAEVELTTNLLVFVPREWSLASLEDCAFLD